VFSGSFPTESFSLLYRWWQFSCGLRFWSHACCGCKNLTFSSYPRDWNGVGGNSLESRLQSPTYYCNAKLSSTKWGQIKGHNWLNLQLPMEKNCQWNLTRISNGHNFKKKNSQVSTVTGYKARRRARSKAWLRIIDYSRQRALAAISFDLTATYKRKELLDDNIKADAKGKSEARLTTSLIGQHEETRSTSLLMRV